jgi:hypothetical protein
MNANKLNRWNWLLAPVGYATLAFLFFLGEWWWQQPTESGSLNFSLDARALRLIFKEALYQGVIVLVITSISLSMLPRIQLRHAVYVSLASLVAMYVVGFAAAWMRTPITTNGGQLMAIVATYAVVLLISAVIIRRSKVHVA